VKNFLILATTLLVLSCQIQKSKPSADSTSRLILISSGQFETGKEISIDGYIFDIVLNEKSDTIYLATADKSFITSDGFRIGTRFGQLPDQLKGKTATESGWGYFIKLDSKWTLGFCEGPSCTDKFPTEASTVKWIFKRK
jgi:hypothetical protein